MFNPQITATAGWSEAVEERARRLLAFTLGDERAGEGEPAAAVTVAMLFERCQYDPVASARFFMRIPPTVATHELAKTIARLRIDGEPCSDPLGMARAALAHAGRAVDVDDIHPERRWLVNALRFLLSGGRSPPRR